MGAFRSLPITLSRCRSFVRAATRPGRTWAGAERERERQRQRERESERGGVGERGRRRRDECVKVRENVVDEEGQD